MMNNKNLVEEIKLVYYYRRRVLSMMNIFELDKNMIFHTWLNEFEYVADKVKVPHDKMGKLLMTMVHRGVNNLIRKKFPGVRFTNPSYDEILKFYNILCLNIGILEFHRIRFFRRIQYLQEPIDEYADNLRKIFNKCYYTGDLEEKLCSQFINGIFDDDIRNYLSETSYISFDEMVKNAIEFARVREINFYLKQAHSVINIYNQTNEDNFHKWLNKFEYVANMIEVSDDKMIEFFNEMVHTDVHKNVKQTYYFIKFSELSYEEIVNHYLSYFSFPFENDLHKSRFICRKQYENEMIVKYANCLRKIYFQCRFISWIEEELYEKFINGIRDDDLRNYLSKSPRLSFQETIIKAFEFSKSDLITSYIVPALSMIKTYNRTTEGIFYEWLNRFEYVADKIKVPDDKMVEFFYEMVYNGEHRRIKKIFLSVNFAELSYDEIINYYLRYYSLSEEINLHRNRFLCRKQYEDESIENYANNLRKIFGKCCYLNRADERLREQFCNGVHDSEVRDKLDEVRDKSFNAVIASANIFAKNSQITKYLSQALSMINIYNLQRGGIFYEWLNKFEYVADVVNVPDHKMVEFFTRMMDKNLKIDVELSYPFVYFTQLSYEMIINNYLRYFALPNETDLHRKRFNCRNQYERETIEKYANNLQKIYNKCDDKSKLEGELCKKFINGILDQNIRNYLNEMPGLSFDRMVIIAVAYENKINSRKGNINN